MRIYLMTDLEGVAGVLDCENWCLRESRYYDLAKELLTEEVNAAVDGFFSAGATYVMVADGHGGGGINPALLDARAELLRGWGKGYPLGLEDGFDAFACVGQHAKARTEFAHLAHTQSFGYLDLSVNGVSVGEFGEMVLCASELGIPTIFGAGDLAFTKEAEALVPGIETVSVKRGNRAGRGDECGSAAYGKRNLGAVHKSPRGARALIREGAARAVERAKDESFGIHELKAPFERIAVFRHNDADPRMYSRESHESSVAELLNLPYDRKPVDSDEQLAELLSD